MTRLCDQLRQIYASGDSMTVLKLIKELIDAVENFEGHSATSEQVEYLTNKVKELEPKVDANTDKVEELEPKVDANTDKVEELEPKVDANTAKHLYRHDIDISGVGGSTGPISGTTLNYGTIKSIIYTASEEPINTVAKLLEFGKDYKFVSNGEVTGRGGTYEGKLILFAFYVNGLGTALMARYFQNNVTTSGVEINITGGITDIVTQIF